VVVVVKLKLLLLVSRALVSEKEDTGIFFNLFANE
jgi:hypothetical protein